jgi:hypothetical protein
MVNWVLSRMPRQLGERLVFSINGTGTTEYPHAKEWTKITTSYGYKN